MPVGLPNTSIGCLFLPPGHGLESDRNSNSATMTTVSATFLGRSQFNTVDLHLRE